MEAVAAADEVAGELLGATLMMKTDFRRLAVKIVDADVGRLEQNLSAIGQPPRDQVFHNFLLAIDGHALAD